MNQNMSVAPSMFSLRFFIIKLLKLRNTACEKGCVLVLRSVLTFSAVESVVFQTGISHGQFEEEKDL